MHFYISFNIKSHITYFGMITQRFIVNKDSSQNILEYGVSSCSSHDDIFYIVIGRIYKNE